jgi:hypothetical protein
MVAKGKKIPSYLSSIPIITAIIITLTRQFPRIHPKSTPKSEIQNLAAYINSLN